MKSDNPRLRNDIVTVSGPLDVSEVNILQYLPVLDQISVLGYNANSADPVQTPSNAAFDQGLHCLLTEISMESTGKGKHPPEAPKTKIELIQMIRMDKPTGQTRVIALQTLIQPNTWSMWYGKCFCGIITRPRGYETFFMLNLTEHESFPTHKC